MIIDAHLHCSGAERGDATYYDSLRAVAVERYDWERVVDGLEAVCSEVTPKWH